MTTRRSYSGLLRQPAWWLLDEDRRLIGSVRAPTAEEARRIFRESGPEHGFERGRWIRRAPS